MKYNLTLIFITFSVLSLTAQESCLNKENLLKLDASWERALLEINLDFIQSTLSENFIWVHSGASRIDSKESVLESGQKLIEIDKKNSKSRVQKDVQVLISGSAAIITGYTTVERFNGTAPTTYNFMRTYTEIDGKCYLVANHTMIVPEKEEN